MLQTVYVVVVDTRVRITNHMRMVMARGYIHLVNRATCTVHGPKAVLVNTENTLLPEAVLLPAPRAPVVR